MYNVPYLIREALNLNGGNNRIALFLRSYYTELLKKANEHHMVVQTNRDRGFIEIYDENKKYLNS